MSKINAVRKIIPYTIPKRLWCSKDYNNIILYALKYNGSMYLQEFVNRGNITDKIPERTFYNHILNLKKRGFVDSELDDKTRRRKFMITTNGEKALKQNLLKKKDTYGDLYSRIQNAKYFRRKEIFEEEFERNLYLLEQIRDNFLDKITDISHFYPKEKFEFNNDLRNKLDNEQDLKRKLIRTFNSFLTSLKQYEQTINKR